MVFEHDPQFDNEMRVVNKKLQYLGGAFFVAAILMYGTEGYWLPEVANIIGELPLSVEVKNILYKSIKSFHFFVLLLISIFLTYHSHRKPVKPSDKEINEGRF